jgi:NAD+ synthase (glutamine-hydrolysing)
MKFALAQLNYHIGNFEGNVSKIKDAINKAKEAKADIVIFAELAISGYPPRDFLEFDHFINQCNESINSIAKGCVGIAAIIGSPSFNPNTKGKRLFNSAYFLADGAVKSIHHKALLPNYDVFDEYRYFEPNKEFNVATYKNLKIAVTICEDLWYLSDDPLYTLCPMDKLMKQKPDVIVNIAASPFNYNQNRIRREIYSRNARQYNLPLFYVNHVGAHTELLFDGGAMFINSEGKIVDELKYFEEDFKFIDLAKSAEQNAINEKEYSKIELIHNALVMGIRDYFQKLNFTKAIIGLSGGIDSAVTLVLAAEALGKENVKAVMMPSRFSSKHSVDDSVRLVNNLGTPHELISIEDAFNSLEELLKPDFKDLPFNIAEENMQARIRAVILMALSNKFNYILLNTSNKSEAAVGYGTLYGDMCGGISILGDVYKTEVYELAEYINRDKKIIPDEIINKAPSAELRPNQKDSDSLPEYHILDKILYQYIELNHGPDKIIAMGFDASTVHKVLKLVNTNEYKRYQTPPILRVSPRAFGMGRRMPIVAKYLS